MDFEELYHLPSNYIYTPVIPIFCDEPEILDIMEYDEELGKPRKLPYLTRLQNLKYPLDLNQGYDAYQFRNQPMQSNLETIEMHLMKKINVDDKSSLRMKVYSTRGVLINIMMTPYLMNVGWRIRATKFNGAIYLAEEPNISDQHTKTPRDTYHFKFRQYCFSDAPNNEPQTDAAIDESKQIYCVYRRQLGKYDILYSAEMSGVQTDTEIKDITNMEELNTLNSVLTKLVPDYLINWRDRIKILRWWLQADFSKSRDMYVGFFDKFGFVRRSERVAVNDLPKNKFWKPEVCTNFFHTVLQSIDNKMAHVDSPYTTYEIKFDEQKKSLIYRVHEGRTKYTFLRDEFISHMGIK